MTIETQKSFKGARVVTFESRMSDVMAQSIANKGGVPLVAPSLQEIPLEKNPEAFHFAERLFAGKINMMILMTGVGTKMLVEVLETRYPRPQIIEALSKITLVARGPKPVKVLRDLNLMPTVTVPEPNTWVEILETLDLSKKGIPLEGAAVAVQEYGLSNKELIEGLKKRKANVIQVPVYRWALPDDTRPLENAVREIASGNVHIAFFTNAMQARHLIQVASAMGMEQAFREGIKKVVISSIGPTCSEALHECDLHVDFEPTHPKMGQLVAETAAEAERLMSERTEGIAISALIRERNQTPQDIAERKRGSVFLKACRLEQTPYTPVWLMRQAGRYMKEYRDIRSRVSFIELCRNKDLAAEVAVTACERINADAAILFSDILPIVEALGLQLEYAKEDGPVITGGAIASLADVDKLPEIEPDEHLSFVFDAVRATRGALDFKTPLIGFSGAPFTLASYIIEGGGSKAFAHTKKLMYADPGAWHALLAKISRGLVKYLRRQIEAGADALQIFDSWVGCLGPEEYKTFVLPHTKSVIEGVGKQVPVIHFGTGTGTFLSEFREAGGDVLGVDFRVNLDEAWNRIGKDRAIQGNLDPVVLLSTPDIIRNHVKTILAQAGGRAGHIFNLGHGILPNTPVENVVALVEMVHEMSRK